MVCSRIYLTSDKWVEQGNYSTSGVSIVSGGKVITFKIPFKDTNYSITMLSHHSDTSTNNLAVQYGNSYYGTYYSGSKTSTSIRLIGNGTWVACGYTT